MMENCHVYSGGIAFSQRKNGRNVGGGDIINGRNENCEDGGEFYYNEIGKRYP